MAEYEAGTAFLQVVPSYKGVLDSITAEARKWGVTAGREFGQSFNAAVLAETGRAPLGPSDSESRRRGASSGGKFAETWKARVEAALKSLPDVEVKADTKDADFEIARLRQRLLELSRAKVGVDIDEKAAQAQLREINAQLAALGKKSPSVRVKVDTKAAMAELAALRAEIDSTVGRDAEKKVSGLATALITLGPALVPFAGGVAAAGGTLAALGVSGVLAFKGIEAEMKAGSQLGADYAAGIGLLKADLAGLESTAAHGVLSGFQSSVSSLNQEMPEFNILVGKTSQLLGDIAAHGVSGLVGGFSTFEPVISQVLSLVDQLAAKFDGWATGPGGAKFASTLSTDIDHLVPALTNLVTLAGHLLSAFQPSGLGALDYLSTFSGLIDALPVDVLKAATTAFIVFKAAVAASAAIKTASASLVAFAGAEDAAAAGSLRLAGATGARGLAGSAGLLASRIAPVAGLIIGAGIAADQAGNATESWATSGNHVKEVAGGIGQAFKDLATFHFNFSGVGKYVDAENQFYALRSDAQDAADAVQHLNDQFGPEIANTINSWANKYAAGVTRAADAADSLILKQATQTGQLSKAPSAFNDYIASLQKAVDADEKWTATGSGATKTLDGTKYSLQAWQQALVQANGDEVQAEGILKGHTLSLLANQAAMKLAQAQQKALADAYAEAQTRLKLTADQVDLYASVLGVSAQQLANGQITADEFATAIKNVKTAVTDGNTAVQGWVAAISQWNQSGKTAADRAQLLGSAMVALNGDALGYANSMVSAAQANQQLVSDMDAQTRATINLSKGTIDYHNAAAAPLLNDLQALQTAAMNAAGATYQHELSIKGAKVAAKDAASVYYNDTRNALISEAGQLGLTHQQAKKLADTYFSWPRDAKTKIEQLGADSVQTTLGKILKDLDILVGKPWTAKVGADTSKARSALGKLIGQIGGTTVSVGVDLKPTHNAGALNSIIGSYVPPKKADGGLFLGAGGPRDDANLVRVSNREYIVNAAATAGNLDLLNAINYGTRAFESGGFTGVVAGSGAGSGSSSPGKRKPDPVIVYQGKTYVSASGSHGLAGHVLFGDGDQFGLELIVKRLKQFGVQMVATTESVAKSVHAVAVKAQRSVSGQIAAAVAPSVTSIPGLRSQLSGDSARATSATEHLDIAKQNLQLLNLHAQALDKHAKALANDAQAMQSSTKTEKAAKAAAEKHAKAVQKVADAAVNMATRGKAAYQKLKDAADKATQAAIADAQALVQQIQQDFQALQQQVADFESSISGGLLQGSDLATVWGQITDNVTQAKQALDSAQQAVAAAQVDTSKLTAAQSAQTTATQQLTVAHEQLVAAQTAGDSAGILAAQTAQTNAVAALTNANANLATAQQDVAQQTGPTADQLQALADAQKNYNDALNAQSGAGLQQQFGQILSSAQAFAGDLNKLVSEGANQSLIAQIAAMGPVAGDVLAKTLIAAGPNGIKQLQATMQQISDLAGDESADLAKVFFGAGVDSMKQLYQGILKQFPELKKALAPILAQLAAMFVFTPTVSPTAATGKTVTIDHIHQLQTVAKMYGVTMDQLIAANPSLAGDTAKSAVRKGTKLVIPSFASGVEDFGGGLAYVHKNELLVNLSKGTSVYPQITPASQLPAAAFNQQRATVVFPDRITLLDENGSILTHAKVMANQTFTDRVHAGLHVLAGDRRQLNALVSPHALAASRL